MNCPFQMDTGAYALGILAQDDRDRMTLHLEGCSVCRADVAEFTAMLRRLQSIIIRPSGDTPDRDGPVPGDDSARRRRPGLA